MIDGYTQPGTSPNTLAQGDNAVLKIELTGAGGWSIQADDSTVRGLNLQGVSIGLGGTGDVFAGSFVGTDITG
jgi:hypothetical protein